MRRPPPPSPAVRRAVELARARERGPSAAPGLVLPSLPVPPYTPPPAPPATVAQQQPIGGRGTDYEVARVPFVLPGTLAFAAGAGFSPETILFTSQNAWRGCDVFVNLPVLAVDQYLRLRVYSVVQNVRTEIDSALLSLDGFASERQLWVCAARGMGERFEVTAQYFQMAIGAPPAATFNVEIICSDKCVEHVARDGEQPLIIGGSPYVSNTQQVTMPNVRLAGYVVTSVRATPAWLLFINGTNTADPIVHAVGVTQGATIIKRFPPAQQFLFPDGLVIATSTSPVAYAFAGPDEVWYSVFAK